MKELKKPISKELSPMRLFLDDMQAIYNILNENCRSVEMQTDKYEIDDIAKLRDIGVDEVHEFHFKCTGPYIVIDFYPSYGRIYISEDSTVNRGILSEIEDILSKCKRKIAIILNSWPIYVFGGFLIGSSVPIIFRFTEGIMSIVFLIVLVTLVSFTLYRSYRLSLHQHSTIVLSKRQDRINFFRRNKDQIIVGIIIAVVSVALTALVFQLLQNNSN